MKSGNLEAPWMSVKEPFAFGKYHFEFADTARRYEAGSYNLPGIFALGGAFALIERIGIENICCRLLDLTDRLTAGLRDKGYRVVSSRTRSEASAIVSFISDLHDHDIVQRHLENEHRIVIAVRSGRLRASPHFYNSEAEIERLVETLPAH